MSKRVLAGAVVGHTPKVVEAYAETLRETASACEAEVDFAFILDPNASSDLSDILPGLTEVGEDKPDEAEYAVTEQGHTWSEETFHWLAAHKQRLLNLAAENHYDYIFLADSDLMLGQQTLSSLLAADKDIASAVFWTRWQQNSQPLPQVWLTNPYGFEGRGYEPHEFLGRLERRKLTEVWGLGACTLISTDVLGKTGYYPPMEGLPQGGMWRGEDRSFCIRAERNHVEMYADPWPDVAHLYRPSQQSEIPKIREELKSRNKSGPPSLDDMISATVEPCEPAALANHKEHLRGTLGRLDILPDLRDALREMRPGEDRMVEVEFPRFWPEMQIQTNQGMQDLAPQYRGSSKWMRVTLLGIKPEKEPMKL